MRGTSGISLVLLVALALVATQQFFHWSSREPSSRIVKSQRKQRKLRYDVTWSKFESPLRESLLRPSFVRLSRHDPDTLAFIKSCYDEVSLLKEMAANFLRQFMFMSKTDANAYTNRGHMFVLSLDQFKKLVPEVQSTAGGTDQCDSELPALLDIGAGDGGVTERIASQFGRIVVTEASSPMLAKLKQKGWEAYAPNELPQESGAFNVITCFNVLDRADKPVSLLKSLQPLLKPGGRLVLAVVLPFCPYVASGSQILPPSEKLDMDDAPCKGTSFELSAQRLLENTIFPLGYKLERWTRLPYISQGNRRSPYVVLNDAVFILSLEEHRTPKR